MVREMKKREKNILWKRKHMHRRLRSLAAIELKIGEFEVVKCYQINELR